MAEPITDTYDTPPLSIGELTDEELAWARKSIVNIVQDNIYHGMEALWAERGDDANHKPGDSIAVDDEDWARRMQVLKTVGLSIGSET